MARSIHAVTALIAVAAVVTQVALVSRGVDVLVEPDGGTAGTAERLLRFFSYFTVQSNLLVAVVCTTLALHPDRDGPRWRVLRLAHLLGITVTGIVYAVVLAPLVHLEGISAVTDVAFHYVTPVLSVVGWLVFGPRPRVARSTLGLALLWPVAYLAYTLTLGAISGWYPYPFMDTVELGYPRALLNCAGVTALMVAVGGCYLLADRRLPASTAR